MNSHTYLGAVTAEFEPKPEVDSFMAMRNVLRVLPPIERAYAEIRFKILRAKLLSTMDLLLPDEGRILDVGCGFGLFAGYFGQMHSGRAVTGVDPDARRVHNAQRVAKALGHHSHQFLVGDVRSVPLEETFDAAYVLDVMHHIPREEQVAVLERLARVLRAGGVLVIKDVTTTPSYGLRFTELLDRLMVGFDAPLAYRHHQEWAQILQGMGFRVKVTRIPDVLPYPHVLLAATKELR